VCRDNTLRHKPHPEPYSTALKLLNCLPENSFAIEDSPLGIASAKAAGLKCIAVGCSLTRDMDLSDAHYVFNTLKEVSFSELCKNL
jgi:beta-phosphoglucomutase-like phosphatase (HAD superfamily)